MSRFSLSIRTATVRSTTVGAELWEPVGAPPVGGCDFCATEVSAPTVSVVGCGPTACALGPLPLEEGGGAAAWKGFTTLRVEPCWRSSSAATSAARVAGSMDAFDPAPAAAGWLLAAPEGVGEEEVDWDWGASMHCISPARYTPVMMSVSSMMSCPSPLSQVAQVEC